MTVSHTAVRMPTPDRFIANAGWQVPLLGGNDWHWNERFQAESTGLRLRPSVSIVVLGRTKV